MKIILRIIISVVAFVIIVWLGIALYVSIYKQQVLEKVTAQINENISGEITVESMDLSLIRGFPGISVNLRNVLLRDSLYAQHKKNLLKAKNVYAAANILSIIRSRPQIQKISIDDAEIYLYTDSAGYRNTNLFKPSNPSTHQSRKKIEQLELNNVLLSFDNRLKGKFFSFEVHSFLGKIDYQRDSWKGKLETRTTVRSLTFNKAKGSYLKNKLLNANLRMSYNYKTRELSIPVQKILLDSDALNTGGKFSFAANSDFTLNIQAPAIHYKNALTLLTPAISSKLEKYGLEKPFEINAKIRGLLKVRNLPLVHVAWKVRDNNLRVNNEWINHCSFSARYSNELKKGLPRRDPNSAVYFYDLQGSYAGIKFNSDSVKIVNLKLPVIEGRFTSNFSLSKLNALTGSETFEIQKGLAQLNLLYKAPFNQLSPVAPYIYGTIRIKDAQLNYVPRNLKFRNVTGLINFKGQNLSLDNLNVQTSTSQLYMQGTVNNFLNFYYSNPGRIRLDWQVESPQINLTDFLVFLGRRKVSRNSNAGGSVARMFRQLDNVLDEASVKMDLRAQKLIYRRFHASNVRSDLSLNQNNILIRNISLNHSGGSVTLKGNIDQHVGSNKFNIKSKIDNVDIRNLFYAFENFGQPGISYQNLRGQFFAEVRVAGLIRDNGRTVPGSFYGAVNFNLKNGALVNFEPMERVGKFAFPKRNFSNITFNNLQNTLDIQGNKIIIRPMVIRSSVLNLFVQGVYGIPKGTNIFLEVPLRNPQKDVGLPDSVREERERRGLVVRLSAVDGEDGQVKIKLGKAHSENKARKEKDKNQKEEVLKR